MNNFIRLAARFTLKRTLPNNQHLPTHAYTGLNISLIANYISAYFLFPKLSACRWPFAYMAAMAHQKQPPTKNNGVTIRETKSGLPDNF
jgi:hypothetical protein